MRFRALFSVAAAAAVVCATASTADAQLGGMIRRAAQRATQGAQPQAPAQQQAGGNDDVAAHRARIASAGILEMNAANLDRMMLALRTERAYMDSIAALKRAAKTPEQYGACMMEVYTNNAQMKIVNDSVGIFAERQDMTGVSRMGERQQAIMSASCGLSAGDIQRIEQEARRERTKRANEAAGFGANEYAYMKERLTPFCAVAATVAAGEVRLPGDGRNIYWVYAPVEVEQLKTRCGELTAAVNAVS